MVECRILKEKPTTRPTKKEIQMSWRVTCGEDKLVKIPAYEGWKLFEDFVETWAVAILTYLDPVDPLKFCDGLSCYYELRPVALTDEEMDEGCWDAWGLFYVGDGVEREVPETVFTLTSIRDIRRHRFPKIKRGSLVR